MFCSRESRFVPEPLAKEEWLNEVIGMIGEFDHDWMMDVISSLIDCPVSLALPHECLPKKERHEAIDHFVREGVASFISILLVSVKALQRAD